MCGNRQCCPQTWWRHCPLFPRPAILIMQSLVNPGGTNCDGAQSPVCKDIPKRCLTLETHPPAFQLSAAVYVRGQLSIHSDQFVDEAARVTHQEDSSKLTAGRKTWSCNAGLKNPYNCCFLFNGVVR